MQLTGSQIVIECLKEQGVDTVFGYPGGAILNVYDELYKHKDEITHILTSHEQGAAHAADGYARATGKVGVCLATSGPGATNLVTGIATAYMDSIPVVAITCNVGVSLLGKDSFQEIDIAGVTMPITKHNYIVKDVNNLADTIRKAFVIAKEGRPGPVLIDIPKDVTANKAEFTAQEPKVVKPSENICEKDLESAVRMIRESEKPYIFVGGGAVLSGASKELYEFVKKVDAPVTDSLMVRLQDLFQMEEKQENHFHQVLTHLTVQKRADFLHLLTLLLSCHTSWLWMVFLILRQSAQVHLDTQMTSVKKILHV